MANDSGPGPLEKLATSRARFISELGEKLAAARLGLARVGIAGADPGAELNSVRRRLHALAAAADVLHFTTAADALRRAEAELTAGAAAPSPAPVRERVTRVLDLVPSLALGAAVALDEELAGERASSPREPLCALIFGGEGLETALAKPGPLHGAELHRTQDPDALPALIGRLGPDVLVLDADYPALAELVPRLRQAGAPGLLPLVAVGSFESYDALQRLVRRGVTRVLPAPVDAGALQRTLRELALRGPATPTLANPLSDAGGVALADAIAAEARRAFSDPSSAAVPTLALAGDPGHEALAALWSAFARIRSLAVGASEGRLHLPLAGPYGMIPLAPTLAAAPGQGGAPAGIAGEALAGRRLVVADTDPILLGALSRSLQRLGASVLPARDAEQALELAERHWPDALIADVQLPALGGLELCRRLREDLALADIPVALICWKEDLLQHARRASEQRGSEPRPISAEAFAPVGDALARRFELERRLERDGAVHGRLDGLSPRLLLELCSRRSPGSLLTLRSGRLTAEAALVDGRPLHARLLDAGAPVAEGPAALGPLLGMRAGRFGIEPLASAPPAHFSGDLMTVLAPPIARARRARAWLSTANLGGLERVELEPRVAAHCLEDAPPAQRAALARLLRGETLRAVRAADGSDASSPLTAALLELARRGGLVALFDASGADLLAPDAERAAARGGRARRESPPMPAALTLAEAVLQAVSVTDADERPNGRRTHRGLAPPQADPDAPPARTPPLPDPTLADALPGGPGAEASGEPREVPEAWSSEPDSDEEPSGGHSPPSDELGDDPPPPATIGARLRSIVSPVLVTVAAAAVAFAGMRVVMGGALDHLGVAPWVRLFGGTPAADSGAQATDLPMLTPDPAPPSAPTTPTTPEPSDASASSAAAAGGGSAAPATSADAGAPAPLPNAPEATAGVAFTVELLELPPGPALPAGHGLLELQTWEPQRLYVDGVFVGNYVTRRIPLAPGTYRARFGSDTRELEHPVTIAAGRRTRLTARAEKAP